MGLNTKCPIHGNLHPDFLCPDKEKNTYKYRLKQGDKVVCYGITYDLARRQAEHRKDYPGATMEQVGERTTWKKAVRWERRMGKRIKNSGR